MARYGLDYDNLKKLVLRSNTAILHTGVLLFQVTAMLLLTFKTPGTMDNQALFFAVAMPVCTEVVYRIFGKIWPLDRAMLLLFLFLLSVGLVTLKSISRYPDTPWEQSIFMAAGFIVMAFGIVFVRRLRSWEKLVPCLAVLSVIFLALPLAFGVWKNGAKNWLQLKAGGMTISIQPSEFIKISLIYILAACFSRNARLRESIVPVLIAGVFCVILLAEKDLGAVLLFYLTTVGMFYAATSNLTLTLAGLAAGAAASVYAYQTMNIVKERVAVFLDPWSDPLNNGYQLVQALIAIGSGGLFGSGLGLGAPRNVPLYYSDFIFASIAEQYGLVFSIALIAVYVLLLMRGLSTAANARSSFHALLAFGIVLLIGAQTFVNIGGNIKLIPMTGVTLPYISSGGSSLISLMLAAGMLLGISSINAEDEDEDLLRLQIREAGR